MEIKRTTIWDPLRKKDVAMTPEEGVRQWCIEVLAATYEVPYHMMMSEASFKLGDKRFRADILIYDRSAVPVAVVECKRPEVDIDETVLDQAVRYNMVLNVRFIIITNGRRTCVCRRDCADGIVRYRFTDSLPKYDEMICQQ